MKIEDIYVNVPLLQRLAQRELPAAIGYRVGTRLRILAREWQAIEEQRQALLQRHGRKDENGNLVTNDNDEVQFEDREAYQREWREFLADEATVEVIPFSAELFDKYGDVPILPAEVAALDALGCLEA